MNYSIQPKSDEEFYYNWFLMNAAHYQDDEQQFIKLCSSLLSMMQEIPKNSDLLLDQVMPVPPCNKPHTAIKAYASDPDTVVIEYTDGCKQTRSGGSRSWRNNNPGNVTLDKLQPNIFGALGANGRFEIYPDEEIGFNAIVSWLNTPSYQQGTLLSMIQQKYAPPNENNSIAYANFISDKTGIPESHLMNTLSQEQIKSIADAIKQYEGWMSGRITWQAKGSLK